MNNQTNKGWVAWFAYNSVAANLLMVTLLALGLITVLNMRTEGFPAEAPRNVTVTVNFNGASPEDVEEGAAIKVEQALNGVQGIKDITSTVTADAATVAVRGLDGYPLGQLQTDIKNRVDGITSFPAQVESTTITVEQEQRHVIYIQLFGAADHATMRTAAQRIRKELLELSTVNLVSTEGARTAEITIELQEESLRAYGLSFEEVAQAIQGSSLNLSAGTLDTPSGRVTLQTRAQAYSGSELNDIVLRASADGGMVRLGDVARIVDGFNEDPILSIYRGQPSIRLDVQLIGKDSITEASDAVQLAIARINQANWLPETIELETWSDEAQNIRDRLQLMSKNALMGMGLVFLMLALFLDLRVAFWVAVGIPITFMGTVYVIGPSYLDYSLNDLTTFAFIIVLGIVVDDAIVIGENIYTHKKRDGGGVETAVRGALEVATPATFGVLTTVAAFYPLTTITGDFGGPFRLIAIVVIICLLFSLVESKLILPAHLGHLNLKRKGKRGQLARLWGGLQSKISKCIRGFIDKIYTPTLRTVLNLRYQSLGVFLAILIATIGLITNGVVRTNFFPDGDSNLVYLDISLESGIAAERTKDVAKSFEQSLLRTNEEFQESYGTDTSPVAQYYISSIKTESIQITVNLLDGTSRTFGSSDFIDRWRTLSGKLAGVTQLDFYSGFGGITDLELKLSSPDPEETRVAMERLRDEVNRFSGVYDVKTNLDNLILELSVNLLPEGTAFGLSNRDIVTQLRNSVFGYEAQRIQRGEDEVRVMVRYPQDERNSITDLTSIRIRTASGGTIPLSNIAIPSQRNSQLELKRIDGNRVLELSAKVDRAQVTPAEVLSGLENGIFADLKRDYPNLKITIAGESQEQGNATSQLLSGFMLGLMLIYTLLAIPLKSYIEPFVIMLAIPFGIVGAVIGHWVIGIPVSLLSTFGILALSGVVVNDSLVLVSRYKDERQTKSAIEAVIAAGRARFRAIFLTSVTTFAGLAPLIAESSEQAQLLIPMAVSLAFGILFATVITLLIIPVLLLIREDITVIISREHVEGKTVKLSE